MKTPYASRGSRGGFTLAELIVAIAVLSILVLALSTMMVSVMGAVTGGMKHLDADTAARVALDRIALDVSRMVRRTDVDYYFQKNTTGSDQMAFFSETSGYFPSTLTPNTQGSSVSLIGYRINSSNQLERLSKGLAWNGVSGLPTGANPMVYLPRTICTGSLATWPGILTTGSGSDTDYQVIGDQIFRMEICFLVQNSTTAATLADQPWLTPDTSVNGMQDVVAVVVGLAVLDSQALKRLSSTQISTAAAALSKDTMSTTPPSGPLAVWQAQLNGGATFGLPAYAAGQLRFYQRYCYLGRTN